MSKSVIQCPACHQPIAYRKDSGALHFIFDPERIYQDLIFRTDGALMLVCSCGSPRRITPPSEIAKREHPEAA